MNTLTVGSSKTFSIASGNLTVRLASSTEEINAPQSLRYRVFYEEMNAKPSSEMQVLRSDFDSFDEICDHLLVISEDRIDLPGAVVDSQYNTTAVFIIVKTNLITQKYFRHYERFAFWSPG